jgi:transcriptional regulator with XRE-family HTH domain
VSDEEYPDVASKLEVGDRLYMLRHARRLSLDTIQKRTKIPASTVSRWERGAAAGYPPIERLAQLAQLYEVTISDLLTPPENRKEGPRDVPRERIGSGPRASARTEGRGLEPA